MVVALGSESAASLGQPASGLLQYLDAAFHLHCKLNIYCINIFFVYTHFFYQAKGYYFKNIFVYGRLRSTFAIHLIVLTV